MGRGMEGSERGGGRRSELVLRAVENGGRVLAYWMIQKWSGEIL